MPVTSPLETLRIALGSRYELGEVIGRGGMATVYRAQDRELGRTVAIKVLSPDLAPLLGEHRFQREIGFAARLQHPGIVPLYEAGGSGPIRYYTMPFVAGETLRQRLDRTPQLPIDEAIHIALEVADALRHAHTEGVVHRDIKPENILLTGERVQVADFGIAHAISAAGHDRLTSAGVAIGTPAYMSPEQATNHDAIDGRADIYSLGCLLFEMLSGQPPFTGATPQTVMARHVGEPPPSLTLVRPTLGPAIGALVARTLAKAPADRPDAAQFLSELHRAMAHPESTLPVRSRRLWRGAAAVLALAGVAAAGYLVAGRSTLPIDPNAVVVFPLATVGATVVPSDGELVALWIGTALEHTEPLRWTAGWKELKADARIDPSRLSAREARRTARRMGARWYVEGDLLPVDNSLTVTLRLHDIIDGTMRQESVRGPLRNGTIPTATTLALQAVIPLLETLVGSTRHVELASLNGRDPAAIAIWLQGEQQKRTARFEEALTSYRRALAIDSTLAVAASTAAGMVLWTTEAHAIADSFAQLALRHGDGLAPKNLAFTRGIVQFVARDADAALRSFGQALEADSTWSEGWMMVGDSYYHLLPTADARDSLAEVAFRRAVDLDPGFSPALFHLAELTVRRGDTRTGKRLADRFRELSADSARQRELDLLLACQTRRASRIDWPSAVRAMPLRVLVTVRLLGAGALHAECAAKAAEAILAAPPDSIEGSHRWAALMWLHHWAIARGDIDSAITLIDSGIVHVHPAAEELRFLDAVEFGIDSARAAPRIVLFTEPLDSAAVDFLWYRGRLAALRGDRNDLGLVIEALARRRDAASRNAVVGLRARALLLGGDTVAAIRQLEAPSPPSEDVGWTMWQSGAADRVLLARLLLARGNPAAAAHIAASLDGIQSVVYLTQLPAAWTIRQQAAEQLGDGATAERFKTRLRQLGRTPGN